MAFKKILRAVYATVFAALLITLSLRNQQAYAYFNCSPIEDTGATQDVCNRGACNKNCGDNKNKYCGWRYGAIFFTGGWSDEDAWPTWSGSGSLDFSVRGAVYCCADTSNTAYTSANSIGFSDNITISSDSLTRACGGNDRWGPISSDRIKATVPEATLGKASCNSSNPQLCTLTVNVTSTLGSGSAATYNSYIKFYKGSQYNYKLDYHKCSGSGGASDDTYGPTSDTSHEFTIGNNPSRDGYSFAGWSTASCSGTATKSKGDKVTATSTSPTVDLYAIWRPLYNYSLTYDKCGGSGGASDDTYGPTTDTSHDFTIGNDPSKTDHYFIGWSTTSCSGTATKTKGGKVTTTSTSPSATLYAIWGPVYYGTVSGALSIGAPDGTSLISGSSYLGTYSTSDYSATVSMSLTRTDSESNISTISASGTVQKSDTATGTFSNTSKTISGSLGLSNSNKTVSDSYTININNIGRNSSGTTCRRLHYGSAFSFRGGVQTKDSDSDTSPACITIYRPTRATFFGVVATPTANNDSNLSSVTGGLMGNGSTTSYKVKTTYTITRTNNSPESAKTKYSTSNSSQPSSAATLSNALKQNETQNPTSNNTKTITVAVGTKETPCFFLTYEDWIEYYNSVNRLNNNYHLGEASACVDVFNPMYATFTGSIKVTSTMMTGNDSDGFRGNGYDTTYEATSSFKVKRTNDTPTRASSRFRYYIHNPNDGTNASYDPTKYPAITATPALTASNKAKDEQEVAPVDISFSVPNGATRTKCFYLSYDDKVGYVDGTIFAPAQNFNGRKYKCVDFYNPLKFTATFSASISTTNGTYLSNNDSETNGKTGNGLRSRFSLTPTYTIKRTNNSPTIGVYSRYAYSDVAMPAANATKTNSNSLKKDETQSFNGSAKTVNVQIGGSAQQCFHIRYDANVTLIGDDDASATVGIRNGAEDRDFNGTKTECYNFTNPPRKYTAHFDDAVTVGTLDEHDRLIRTNENHDGKIDNHRRITTGDDSVIGTYEWAFPSDDKYLATFTHTIFRTDNVITDTNNNYYVESAKVNWKIQYQNNASGVWSDYSTSLDNNSNVKVSGSFYLSGKNTTNVKASTGTKPKFIMNLSNVGTYTIHCQRIAYNAETYYETRYDPNNLDGHLDYITGYSDDNTKYSTPVCVSIKNPNWHESNGDILTHQIDVTGATNGTEINTGDLSKSGNDYDMLAINPNIFVNHKLTRTDSGDDESDAVFNGKFWQRSIYNNDNYKVRTNLSAYEKIIGFDTTAVLSGVVAGDNPDGSLKVRLGASSKNNGDTFSSTKSKGASKLDFNAKGTNKYSVMAGQTKTFTVATNNLPTRWTVRYKKIQLKEFYVYGAESDVTVTFDRIEKVDSEPQTSTTPAKYTSSAESFTMNRQYNFIIKGDTPSVISGSGNEVVFAGDTITINYKIDIGKENNVHKYITDPNETDNARYVYAVSYVLPINVTSNAQTNAATSSGIESSICNHFNAVAKSGSCTILTDTDDSHPKKLNKHASSSIDPRSTPSGAVTDTVFRHVYDLTGYSLGYTTSSITVPANLDVGEKFCVAIAIRNYSSVSTNYYITKSSCRNIAKKPKAQVWGGSVITNGGISSSKSTLNNKIYSSWADFAIIAGKDINEMNSGASTISGAPSITSLCERNKITISNKRCTESDHQLGNSGIDARTDFNKKVLSYLQGDTSNISDLPGYNSSTNTHSITSGSYIIRSSSDITINRNIVISGEFTNKITPQVIIIAPNINIVSSVTRIDAWLIASNADAVGGTIDTCSDVPLSSLTSADCTEQLVINGALSAAKINFKRTNGADAANNTMAVPAEIVNSSPSILFWTDRKSVKEIAPTTTVTRELPPRY